MKAVIYITYQLVNLNNVSSYKDAAHCNYINEVEVDTGALKEINFFFGTTDDFKYLKTGTTSTSGFTATNIYLLVQKVLDGDDILPNGWKIYDVTSQITGHVSGNTLSASELCNTVFKINLTDYDSKPIYNLGYLNYPISGSTELSFGDEEYFIGNVESDIETNIFPMNLNIPVSDFSYSTNLTWEENSDVYISEVGLYDESEVLIGIGKLRTPVKANSSSVIVFGLDF
jgi:hypothetical protein